MLFLCNDIFTDPLDCGYLKNVEAIVGQIKIRMKTSYNLNHLIFQLFKSSILLIIYFYIYILPNKSSFTDFSQ
jgi:hypothetical protein